MAISKLMVVDDDPEMREMMTQFLRKHGFFVLTAESEEEIARHLETSRIDLILLDVMLGQENGVRICERLREEQDVPIILVSALSADHHRMAGYSVGADDYIAKPFNPDLLLARVRAVLRRGRRSASLQYRRNISRYVFQGWSFDAKTNVTLAPDGFQVALSQREIALLKVLVANPHIALTRQEIAEGLDTTRETGRHLDVSEGRAIDVLVGRLRSKIESNPKEPDMLRTARGVGYVFAVDVDVSDG
ncbi:response regulator [Thalassococcus sp. S3]|uniref:response regulator n=1 Tax=Thalassococcus sp. S3 TaxID=2017482 RepID=UPI0010245CAE|nr:response regulator transcription factor [Thalassococcus sp. S3]QBF30853.1 DNA-binding response regulator [Thalassococcus sp. S3]